LKINILKDPDTLAVRYVGFTTKAPEQRLLDTSRISPIDPAFVKADG
jgi:hypothetical protein